jgi:acyl carrier protein
MTTRSTILTHIREVATEQGKTLAPLTDELPLTESGLDSLCFAILVARLEDTLGADPFTSAGSAHFPVTIGDLIALYDDALV